MALVAVSISDVSTYFRANRHDINFHDLERFTLSKEQIFGGGRYEYRWLKFMHSPLSVLRHYFDETIGFHFSKTYPVADFKICIPGLTLHDESLEIQKFPRELEYCEKKRT